MLQCVRAMCVETAAAGLGYDVPAAKAWLFDLDAVTVSGTTRHRDVFMPLCTMHADRITVPVGWVMNDERVAAQAGHGAQPGGAGATVGAGALGSDTVSDAVGADSADPASAPLFTPRTRPAPESAPGANAPGVASQVSGQADHAGAQASASPSMGSETDDASQSSMIERAFRAAPSN